ncbi:MAG TPA: putative Ig domain-containing protein [Candidatus Eisenbacteria bacterium]|nr:putative Ig domain-containing protein [Candidatus Eisenbacteria bacterium]
MSFSRRGAGGAGLLVVTSLLLSLLVALPAGALAAAASMPGDTLSVVTLNAAFDGDTPNKAPDTSLPGAPDGDYLTLDTSAGTIQVVPSYDGLSRPVEVRQVNDPGRAMLFAHAAPTPAPPEQAVARWRSVARDDEAMIQMAIVLRASNGAILASVEYLHQGLLAYNGSAGASLPIPVTQQNRIAQQFTITANFLARTTALSIDGVPISGFQAVPFAQSGDDVATVEIGGQGGHPQTVYADDISVVARYRVPDRAPAVTAPASIAGSEGSALAFEVSASDPDGQAIESLAAAPIPAGAAFTPNASSTSGSFAWTPGYAQAGGYSITFTAANALSASAVTAITVADVDRAPSVTAPVTVSGPENALLSFAVSAADPDGDAIASLTAAPLPSGAAFTAGAGNGSGTFSWTPGFAASGSYSVTFTAANALSGSATTTIVVSNEDRAPVVTAPPVVDGEEGGVLAFTVSAADPDGEPIGALEADLGALPAGHDAAFTPGAGNLSGEFQWPMKRGEAGSYSVAFTASNGATGAATTVINVAFAGTSVTGQLIWTPRVGEEGIYTVTFTATNSLAETGTATTTLTILPSLGAGTSGNESGAAAPPSADATLAPEAPMKGPIVRAPTTGTGTTEKTLTVSATATDDGAATLAPSRWSVTSIQRVGSVASGIVDFDADRSGLPPGNNSIWVVDQDPVVSAPLSRTADPGDLVSFTVTAGDPDGDPILGLDADLSQLPPGNTASFTASAPFQSGTFAWTPRAEDAGTFVVTFTAFNELVGSAATTITVRPVAPASIFVAGQKKIRLSSNRPFGCVQIEPINESFSLFDVDLTSIRMVSTGTGSVSEITANLSKEAVIGDRDNDQIQDMQVCFEKTDLRALFSLLRGSQTVRVIVRGRLVSGSLWEGPLDLDIVAGGGQLQAVLSPNPLNPAGTLTFLTKSPGRVKVALFDLNGRLVRTLRDEASALAGAHEVAIDGRGSDRRTLPSGVYFFRIESPDGSSSGRFTVLK